MESSTPPTRSHNYTRLIEAARVALRRSENEEAAVFCREALDIPELTLDEQVQAQCLIAEALENLAREREAIEVLSDYTKEAIDTSLSPLTLIQVYLRLGSAYDHAGDPYAALDYARQARAIASHEENVWGISGAHLLMGRVYRHLGEPAFAREHYGEAIEAFRLLDQPSLLAQAWFGLGIVNLAEGDLMGARHEFDRASQQLVSEDALLLRGKLEMNRAVLAHLQGQAREGVERLEQAVEHFTQAHHPRLLAMTHINLGFSLLQLGEIERARQLLETALVTARTYEAPAVEAAALDTIGEMEMSLGRLDEAVEVLQRSIETAHVARHLDQEAQAHLTLGRCWLARGEWQPAAACFQQCEALSEICGDRRESLAAKLFLAEAWLLGGKQAEAREMLEATRAEMQAINHLSLIGHWRELAGRLAAHEKKWTEAISWLQQAASIFELISYRYRAGVAYYHLGDAQARSGSSKRAQRAWEQAEEIFDALNARVMLEKTLAAMAAVKKPESSKIESVSETERTTSERAVISALSRLLDASNSRELLLRELTIILHQDFNCSPVIIYEHNLEGRLSPLCFRGIDERAVTKLAQKARGKSSRRQHQFYEIGTGDMKLVLYLGTEGASIYPPLLELLLKETAFGLKIISRWPRGESARSNITAESDSELILPGLIHRSKAMRQIAAQIYSFRDSHAPVLITGESGTGKELIAQAIHALSRRSKAPFVPFNCAAIPGELIESLLFGHKRGAFTGAATQESGIIRATDGGTLFLDEIGELATTAQPKLLRFLAQGEIQPLGETKPRLVDVRVIAATNRNLEELVAAGKFRVDLYYRLNVIDLPLLPLRERREEIPLLAEYFLKQHYKQIEISPEAMDLLFVYDWPGNIRELEHEMMRLAALLPNETEIVPDHLSSRIRKQVSVIPARSADLPKTMNTAVTETERTMLLAAFKQHQGNITQIAKELGMTRHALRAKLKRDGIIPKK